METRDPIPEEVGEVIDVFGNTARVKVAGKAACAHCGVCTKVSDSEMIVDAVASETLRKGDRVSLVMKHGMVVKSAFIVYMIPLFSLIGGYYLGNQLFTALGLELKDELFPALFGFFCLGMSFLAIRWYDRKKRNDERFQVYVKKIVE